MDKFFRFDALNLVPFNINPHYADPEESSTHKGETRADRIKEFHVINEAPVLGLREGTLLVVDGDKATLKGVVNARLFTKFVNHLIKKIEIIFSYFF